MGAQTVCNYNEQMTFLHFILPDLGSNCLQMQSADDILPGLIWVQNIYKFNQQTTFLLGLFFNVINRRYLVWPDLGLNCFNWNQQTTFCPTLSGLKCCKFNQQMGNVYSME